MMNIDDYYAAAELYEPRDSEQTWEQVLFFNSEPYTEVIYPPEDKEYMDARDFHEYCAYEDWQDAADIWHDLGRYQGQIERNPLYWKRGRYKHDIEVMPGLRSGMTERFLKLRIDEVVRPKIVIQD